MQRASTFVLAVFVASALLAGCGKEKALVFSFPRAPRIAFVSDRSGLPQIYIVNSDGTGLSRISSTPNSAAQPTWAPNGKAIAFSSVDYVHPAGDILVVSPNGTRSEERRVGK